MLSFLLIILCLCLEGLFSGGEIALIASDIYKIRQKAKKGSKLARIAVKLLEKPEWFLATTLTGTNICVVTSTAIATGMFVSVFGEDRGEFVSVFVMVPTLLVFGEIIPKSIFQHHAELVAMRISPFIWVASWLFSPVVFLISRISRGTLRISKGEKEVITSSYITKGGLKFILGTGSKNSDILNIERDMVRKILDFSEVTVSEIMVPISAVTIVPVTMGCEDAALFMAEKKYLRIPVYGDKIFNIIGILHYFDLVETIRTRRMGLSALPDRDYTIASCLKPVVFYIPEMKLAKELLVELQSTGERMAIVVDEYGGAIGIVTTEDILESVVGEIDDEFDNESEFYKKIGSGRYVFNARVSIERMRQTILLDIPDGEYDTLGGFLLYKLGRIPKRKETLRWGNVIFVIEDVDMKSIKKVLVVLPAEWDKSKNLDALNLS
jgi:CBS domain containing-hemolysin-like protein